MVKDGKVGYIRASRLARNGKIPKTVSLNLEPNPISTETTYFIIKFPEKRVYKSGQKFNIAGYILHSQDVNGVRKVLDNSKINFVISGSTTRISDGTTLSSKGIKRLVCYYDGKDTGQWFDIKVD